jgi:two-component system, response regulator
MSGKFDKITVLIADDDSDDHDFLKEAFVDSEVEANIYSVYNGEELLDFLLKRNEYEYDLTPNPDLIILDLNMPVIDGYTALIQLKAFGFLQKIPVYILTTSSAPEHKLKALKLGATGYYTKTIKQVELVKIVKDVCSNCIK